MVLAKLGGQEEDRSNDMENSVVATRLPRETTCDETPSRLVKKLHPD
jgi:hypothetical protein